MHNTQFSSVAVDFFKLFLLAAFPPSRAAKPFNLISSCAWEYIERNEIVTRAEIETVYGLNSSTKHIGMKPSRAHFAGVKNETVDGLNFSLKHLGVKPSKGLFRWCTNKQYAPK